MKTFKELLHSSQFAKNSANNDYCAKNLCDFITNSNALQPLTHFVPPGIKRHILTIMPSKRDSSEILFALRSYPVCVEFNRFHAKELLYIIHANDEIAQILNLKKYTKIKGYVPKTLLQNTFVEITRKNMLLERAEGKFINTAKDKEIYRIFEEIRAVILTNRKKMQSIENQRLDSPPSDYYAGWGGKREL